MTEDAELAVGATGAVFAADQIVKSLDSEDQQLNHALKAAIGAAVAIGAYELLRRADEASPKQQNGQLKPKTKSRSPHPKNHGRYLAEEILGAYSLGKELLGDRKHHVVHLVAEAIGATGLVQELTAKEKD